MVIIRRFECALAPTKAKVVEMLKANPNYPARAMYRLYGFQFYNTSEYDLAELVNDSDHLAANFKAYIQGFSANIQDIVRSLDFDKQIDKMGKNNRNPSTHVDFLLFRRIDKSPLLVVEAGVASFHAAGSVQAGIDEKKNRIFKQCDIPLLRLRADGCGEEERMKQAPRSVVSNS